MPLPKRPIKKAPVPGSTFKKKRESLNVKRKSTGELYGKFGSANPKTQNLERKKQRLKNSEPRNRLQAQRKESNLKNTNLKIRKVNKARIDAREQRQNNILYKQLTGVAFKELNSVLLRKLVGIDKTILRKVFIQTLKEKNKAFKDLTVKEAREILSDASKKTTRVRKMEQEEKDFLQKQEKMIKEARKNDKKARKDVKKAQR